MADIANIKPSSILCGATEAEYDASNAKLTLATLSATIGIDVSTAGSPGQLSPAGFLPGTAIARWTDRSSGIAVGYPALTLGVRQPSRESRITRIQAKYVSPTLAQTSPSTSSGIQPAPVKAYEMTANLEFLIPEQSTRLERIFFFSRVLSLFLKKINASDGTPTDDVGSPLLAAVIDGEGAY